MRFQPQQLTPFRSARHFYGAELRRHRESASLSLVQLAGIVTAGKSTLARVETAELMPPPGLSAQLDAAFDADGHFVRLYDLARREAHPDQYRRYMDFEREAVGIADYAAHVVPGLLQTPGYARALLEVQPDVSAEDVDARVAARIARQARLTDGSKLYLWAVLDESVLHRVVGGGEVMCEQLEHLLRLSASGRVLLQVSPYSVGQHPLLGGSLTLITSPTGTVTGYEEGIEVGRLYEDVESVHRLQRQYDLVRADALSLAESACAVQRAMERFQRCAENSS